MRRYKLYRNVHVLQRVQMGHSPVLGLVLIFLQFVPQTWAPAEKFSKWGKTSSPSFVTLHRLLSLHYFSAFTMTALSSEVKLCFAEDYNVFFRQR